MRVRIREYIMDALAGSGCAIRIEYRSFDLRIEHEPLFMFDRPHFDV